MPKGKKSGAVSGTDSIVRFAKFLSWGKIAQLHNAAGSHRLVLRWLDEVMPWFRGYYEAVYKVPLTDTRLLNLVSTLSARYESWPECDRVRGYEHKAELPPFLDISSILVSDICAVIGYTPAIEVQEILGITQPEVPSDDPCAPDPANGALDSANELECSEIPEGTPVYP